MSGSGPSDKPRRRKKKEHGLSKKARTFNADFYGRQVGGKDRRLVLKFDDERLQEFVGGFRKRKEQRREVAKAEQAEKDRAARREERKTKRKQWQALESSLMRVDEAAAAATAAAADGKLPNGKDAEAKAVVESLSAVVTVTTRPLSLEDGDDDGEYARDGADAAAAGSGEDEPEVDLRAIADAVKPKGGRKRKLAERAEKKREKKRGKRRKE